jgi:prevent-host-death family protein
MCYRGATLFAVRSISQRELRNDNAKVMRAVEAGESVVVTRNGKTVAVLRPATSADVTKGLPMGKPAQRNPRYASMQRVRAANSIDSMLSEMRDER